MKSLTLISLLLLLVYSTKAQFAPKGSTWNFETLSINQGVTTWNEKTIASKDTIIKGKIYSQLINLYDKDTFYLTLDSSKLYYYTLNQHNLLFDFNAKVGDTLIIDQQYTPTSPIFVSKILIDSIKTLDDKFNSTVRQFFFKQIEPPIGEIFSISEKYLFETSMLGLQGRHMPVGWIGISRRFTCYFEPNGYKFILVDSAECNTVSVDEVRSIENTFTIYPNPAQNILYVEAKQPIQSLELYSLEGKLTSTEMQSNTIDISQIANGLYLVKIQFQQNRTEFKKVVIQH